MLICHVADRANWPLLSGCVNIMAGTTFKVDEPTSVLLARRVAFLRGERWTGFFHQIDNRFS